MSAVPLSCFRTQRARPTATARATTLSPRTRGISIVGYGSLEPAARGLVSDSQGDRDDARHVPSVPGAGRIELVRQHAPLELPAVGCLGDGRLDFHARDPPVGRHPEPDSIGRPATEPGTLANGGRMAVRGAAT